MLDIVLYSHESYSDCWPAFFGELERHCNYPFNNRYLFSNETNNRADKSFKHIAYNNGDSYTNRLLDCLKQSDGDKILFTHEDMILCGQVNELYFQEAIDALDNHDFVKLIKGGSPKDTREDIPYKNSEVLKYCRHTFDYVFAIQPTVWNKDKLIELLLCNQDQDIWQFETVGQEYCRKAGYRGLYTLHKDDVQRGQFHWDSTVYPYIATAIHKGKWVTSEYPKELGNLFKTYNIDPSIRGEI
jgi:hypothetical protein